MKKVVLLSSLLTSVMWLALTGISMLVVVPTMVEAQASRIVADELTVGAADGPHLHLGLAQSGAISQLGVYGAGGQQRLNLSTGGPVFQPDPANAGLNIFAPDGTEIARVGTDGVSGALIRLRDRHGQARVLLSLDDDGNPSIQLLDADGNPIWSAP